jgi:hypothetical protein
MEKRRTSSRLREPAAKRRETGEAAEPEQPVPGPKVVGRPRGKYKTKGTTGQNAEQTEEEKPEEKPNTVILPNKLVDGQSLPSLPELQSKKLKDVDWQNVADRYALCRESRKH